MVQVPDTSLRHFEGALTKRCSKAGAPLPEEAHEDGGGDAT